MIFSKKRKNEVKVLQNLGDFAHIASRRKTRFYHLTKKSFCIYGEKKSIGKQKNTICQNWSYSYARPRSGRQRNKGGNWRVVIKWLSIPMVECKHNEVRNNSTWRTVIKWSPIPMDDQKHIKVRNNSTNPASNE